MLLSLDDGPGERRQRFEALVMPLVPRLSAGARRLTRSPQDAADLLQETFLRAYRTFDNFAAGTNARAWLFTIMYSIFANAYHTRQRQIETVSIEAWEQRFQREIEFEDTNAQRLLLEAAVGVELSAAVNEALLALPEVFRSALWLVDVEELSYEEAASVVSCPVGTLRSRLFRARRAMAAMLLADARRRPGVAKDPQHG